MSNILVFDIGATTTRMALAGPRSLKKIHVFPTPQNWSLVEKTFHHEVEKSLGRIRITKVIGGMPGTWVQRRQTFHATNLPAWSGKPLWPLLIRVFGTKNIQIENDANLAGLGEAVHGAGRGYDIVAYLGVGSGVGGTRIVNQRIDLSPDGFRPGHHVIDIESSVQCGCGQRGDLESLVGGFSLARLYHRPADRLPLSAYRRAARYLGVGLNNVTVFWSPDVIVLGGSVIKSLWRFRSIMLKGLTHRPKKPKIIRAALGDIGGLYGALALSQQSRHFPNRR